MLLLTASLWYLTSITNCSYGPITKESYILIGFPFLFSNRISPLRALPIVAKSMLQPGVEFNFSMLHWHLLEAWKPSVKHWLTTIRMFHLQESVPQNLKQISNGNRQRIVCVEIISVSTKSNSFTFVSLLLQSAQQHLQSNDLSGVYCRQHLLSLSSVDYSFNDTNFQFCKQVNQVLFWCTSQAA